MRTFLLGALALALTTPRQSRDLPGLAIAIVEAARQNIGLGPGATQAPIASGPFYIDEQSFVDAFDLFPEAAGNEVRDTLVALGYVGESYANLRRQEVDGLGRRHHWLADDANLLSLDGLSTTEREVTARATVYYTYEGYYEPPVRVACIRQFMIRLLYEDRAWHAVETRIVGQC